VVNEKARFQLLASGVAAGVLQAVLNGLKAPLFALKNHGWPREHPVLRRRLSHCSFLFPNDVAALGAHNDIVAGSRIEMNYASVKGVRED